MTYKSTQSMALAFIVAIAVSVAVNFLNGLMVTKFMTPAFIATLSYSDNGPWRLHYT